MQQSLHCIKDEGLKATQLLHCFTIKGFKAAQSFHRPKKRFLKHHLGFQSDTIASFLQKDGL
jgi:hypothetical protein